jgi:hypothetical protein
MILCSLNTWPCKKITSHFTNKVPSINWSIDNSKARKNYTSNWCISSSLGTPSHSFWVFSMMILISSKFSSLLEQSLSFSFSDWKCLNCFKEDGSISQDGISMTFPCLFSTLRMFSYTMNGNNTNPRISTNLLRLISSQSLLFCKLY